MSEIDRVERDRFAVPPPERIEKKKEREKGDRGGGEGKEAMMLILALLIRWRDFLKPFVEKRVQAEPRFLQEAAPLLHELRGLLLDLERKDKSHDPHFISQLSHVWKKLCTVRELPNGNSPLELRLLKVLALIENYPEGEEFTLGFYLRAVGGDVWHPFPLMEMLARLHKENSLLPAWHVGLSELLISSIPVE